MKDGVQQHIETSEPVKAQNQKTTNSHFFVKKEPFAFQCLEQKCNRCYFL